jgi:hypothetical protein
MERKNILIELRERSRKLDIIRCLRRLRYLRKLKIRDPEFFELNGGSLELIMLYQHLQIVKKWNGVKCELSVLSEAESELFSFKIEKVVPDTYPCGVLVKALEA